ncbi:zinc-finger domain-containing protein [Tropicimonas sediminicola]|uniref:zinc-finger domain-containing protein n=1 Tax=Tropicimonas sediminicola TaxID=1031541 RepID=UPI0015955978|nr:zinc-finger domain-containing protein [Tropicimonas sediminicola]
MIPEPPETEVVTTNRVACDGGEGALGHPRVWLSLGEDGEVECPYCDKKFVLAKDAKAH